MVVHLESSLAGLCSPSGWQLTRSIGNAEKETSPWGQPGFPAWAARVTCAGVCGRCPETLLRSAPRARLAPSRALPSARVALLRIQRSHESRSGFQVRRRAPLLRKFPFTSPLPGGESMAAEGATSTLLEQPPVPCRSSSQRLVVPTRACWALCYQQEFSSRSSGPRGYCRLPPSRPSLSLACPPVPI